MAARGPPFVGDEIIESVRAIRRQRERGRPLAMVEETELGIAPAAAVQRGELGLDLASDRGRQPSPNLAPGVSQIRVINRVSVSFPPSTMLTAAEILH